MILRALFWVAIVAVLMPHEPDLGLGRPGASAVSTMLPASVTQWVEGAASAPQQACADHADSCAAALGIVDTLQNAAVHSLAQVKAEIEASQAQRARRLAYND
jgi:hypothetical protein